MRREIPRDANEFRVLRREGPFVFVLKPAGFLVHNSDFAGPAEETLIDLVERALGERAWPAHRLDRQTSGVVLFTTDRARLGEAMESVRREGSQKRYLAIVRGIVAAPVVVDSPLTNARGNEVDALTRARPIATDAGSRSSLLLVEPETGRIHQVRRHLRRVDHPLVNDSDHGDTRFSRAFRAATGFDRLGLHALTLRVVLDDGAYSVSVPPTSDLAGLIARLYGDDAVSRVGALVDERPVEEPT